MFFPLDLLPRVPMVMPYSPDMENKLRNIETKSGDIGVNFVTKDTRSRTSSLPRKLEDSP